MAIHTVSVASPLIRRCAAFAAVATMSVSLAACGDKGGTGYANNDELVAWVGKVCEVATSANPDPAAAGTPRPVTPAERAAIEAQAQGKDYNKADFQSALGKLTGWLAPQLATFSQAFTAQLKDLKELPAAPDEATKKNFDDAMVTLQKAETASKQAISSLQDNPSYEDVQKTLSSMQSVSVDGKEYLGFITDFGMRSTDLSAAMNQASSCNGHFNPPATAAQ